MRSLNSSTLRRSKRFCNCSQSLKSRIKQLSNLKSDWKVSRTIPKKLYHQSALNILKLLTRRNFIRSFTLMSFWTDLNRFVKINAMMSFMRKMISKETLMNELTKCTRICSKKLIFQNKQKSWVLRWKIHLNEKGLKSKKLQTLEKKKFQSQKLEEVMTLQDGSGSKYQQKEIERNRQVKKNLILKKLKLNNNLSNKMKKLI